MDQTLWCYHSYETSSAVLSHGNIYLVCNSNFWVCGPNSMVLPFIWNLFSSTFTWYYLFSICNSNFESVDEILWYDHSNKTSSAVLSNWAICFAKFTNLMKSWIFAHFLLWSFLGLKKLTDSTFVFKHIYTDTCSVIVEGCQKLHELVFVFHQDFLNWRRFIWVCNKHLQNKYYSSRHRN